MELRTCQSFVQLTACYLVSFFFFNETSRATWTRLKSADSQWLAPHRQKQNQVYSNCSCIQHQHFTNEKIPLSEAKAYSGACKQSCKTMVPFLILLFVVTLVVSIAQMPLLMIILRSVREDERAFALGGFLIETFYPKNFLYKNLLPKRFSEFAWSGQRFRAPLVK